MIRHARKIIGAVRPRPTDAPHPGEPALAEVLDIVGKSDAGIFWATNCEGRITVMFAPALTALGIDPGGMIGRKLNSVFDDAHPDCEGTAQRSLMLKMNARAKLQNHLVRVAPQGDQGAPVWLQISGRPHCDGDQFAGYYGVASDVTALIVDRQDRLLKAKYDEVTGFCNAAYFSSRFEAVLNGLTYAERTCALMVIDIDHLRSANERFGAATADAAIAELAGRLRSVVRHRGEVGRMAADQFWIMLPDVDDRGDLADMAERAAKLLSQPYRVDGRRIFLSATIGVSVAPYDAITARKLIDTANLALRAVKQAGSGGYGFFSSELAEDAARHERIQQDLEGALDRGEFSLRYTPLVRASSQELAALRAELRWDSPEFGHVPPSVFLPMIEASDTAARIGEWMLREACRDAAIWPSSLRLAMSLPERCIKDPDFRAVLADATNAAHLAPARLELEVGEDLFAEHQAQAKRLIHDIASVGARSVITGFGDGSSSITLLADMKFDRVDISPKFIRNWAASPDRANAILSAIVGVSRSFGVPVSVRDLDAMDVFAASSACGVELVHGPIFGAPLTQEEITDPDSRVFQDFAPKGPPRQRAARMTLLRKVGLIHGDHYYDVLLKNISKTGAKVAGVAGVPVGTEVVLDLGSGQLAVAMVVNSDERSQGLQFEVRLVNDGHGGLMTRHRISPYTLAEAGLPVAALSPDHDALRAWKDAKKGAPSFVQLQLTHL
jgi:diguanylate cyclase (GGDEF)-like protein